MFYILHKRKLIPIDPDRVYAFCPQCGVLHAVDLQAEIAPTATATCWTPSPTATSAAKPSGPPASPPQRRRSDL